MESASRAWNLLLANQNTTTVAAKSPYVVQNPFAKHYGLLHEDKRSSYKLWPTRPERLSFLFSLFSPVVSCVPWVEPFLRFPFRISGASFAFLFFARAWFFSESPLPTFFQVSFHPLNLLEIHSKPFNMVAFGLKFLFALVAVSSTLAHPIHEARDIRIVGRATSAIVRRQESSGSEFTPIVEGNTAFKASDPALLQKLADEGQGMFP
jgi:hypothetical protein